MSGIAEIFEWQSDSTRLVKLVGLDRAPTWPFNHTRSAKYYEEPREVTEVVIHHSAGPRRDGLQAAVRLSDWIIRPPKYAIRDGKRRWIGGGRGWPAAPYTFVIPSRPAVVDRRFVVYRIWDDDWRTWHTKGHNDRAVSVVVCGFFRTRHDRGSPHVHPDSTAITAAESLVIDYLLPRYNLDPEALRTHAECGKPACPGDFLESWVQRMRGDDPTDHEAPDDGFMDQRPLHTWAQKQTALVALGFDPGPVDNLPGPQTRTAIEAFQASKKLQQDGVIGPITERAMRVALAQLG